MYFPKGFSTERACRLGELVTQAYAQFDAFEAERPWALSGGYALRAALSFGWSWEEAAGKYASYFDRILRKSRRSGGRGSIKVPIGFIAEKDAEVYLVFRGTRTMLEWLRNADTGFAAHTVPGFGRAHDGFLHIYGSIRDALIATLRSADQGTRLFIAGHSLGAALATLALPDIEGSTGMRAAALYTFGSPRVGDDAFVKAFNAACADRSFRIVNTSDLVTAIPPPVPLAGIVGGYFSHVETPVDFTAQLDDMERNHSMETYLAALGQEVERREARGTLLSRLFRGKRDGPRSTRAGT